MRPSTCGHWASPLLIRAAWSRGAVCVVRGWISRRLWWREWLGRRDADELRDTGDADAINPDAINPHREPSDSIHTYGNRPNGTDPDCDRVSNDNRGRSSAATGHHDNVRGQPSRRRGSGGSGRVAGG